ncbi:FKBP-type peptidyl-prolyl cis-trans isomerase [Jatrophihabitans telluris]|uniref:Peptidyl-prolyl cis-trans isomerase n=1 Tax=Jatrophihabitans telluris TaxID=2038343 RepID=A0ABY4QY91_9ACTN|nr:FKBP-type peptidyl-prolyl cis-trans isomerase [Jatrophihabitans telluris]UQX88480.1 FKBP-type peptidyl-prolyl cis-trans isomerase [Jatrophihabitans telluris]
MHLRPRPVALALVTLSILGVSSCSSAKKAAASSDCGGTFKGVAVANLTDLSKDPGVSSSCSQTPTTLEVKDLVTGTGTAATPTSTVTVQYSGVRYQDGFAFDASWKGGAPIAFPLTGVVPGFTQGIGGAPGVAPMKVGGRRIMILPADLGYGAQGGGADIPPNTPIVFVVDLVKVQ